MESRISIKADFLNNTPVIEVQCRRSEDARDELVYAFLEKLAGRSSWCYIELNPGTDSTSFRIRPIPPDGLKNHGQIMIEYAAKLQPPEPNQ